MGQSTDAYLIYGVPLEGEGDGEGEYEPFNSWEDTLQTRDDVVQLIDHCSCEYPMWILGIRGYKMAWRGSVKRITEEDLTVDPEWNDKIIAVATEFDLLDLFDPESIGWHLASMWC